MHLVCFIIRIYHDARFSECQIRFVGIVGSIQWQNYHPSPSFPYYYYYYCV
jgi:hypothetical protein